MSFVCRAALTLFALIALAPAASAEQVTCYVTADNHYGLYVAGPAGENLRFYGRNEYGTSGDPGGSNWSIAETLHVEVNQGEYVYVAAWNDGGPGGWAGDFVDQSGQVHSTDATWVGAVSPLEGFGEYSELPSNEEIESTIADMESQFQWEAVVDLGPNQGLYDVQNILPTTSWIWLESADSYTGVLLIFRSDLDLEPTSTNGVSWGSVKSLFR